MPLSRFITLAWGMAGLDGQASVVATSAFIKMARDWMARHGYRMPWVWVQERGTKFGQHAHILLHIPAELDLLFRPMPRRWVKSILGGVYVTDTVDTKRLNAAHSARIAPHAYQGQLLGRLHYMLKCAPAALECELQLAGWGIKSWGQRSLVIGKRAAVWQGWKKAKGGDG